MGSPFIDAGTGYDVEVAATNQAAHMLGDMGTGFGLAQNRYDDDSLTLGKDRGRMTFPAGTGPTKINVRFDAAVDTEILYVVINAISPTHADNELADPPSPDSSTERYTVFDLSLQPAGVDISSVTPIDTIDYRTTDNQTELQTNGDFSEGADSSATGTGTTGWSWANSGWTTTGSLAKTLVDSEVLTSDATAVSGDVYFITYTIGTSALQSIVAGGVSLSNVGIGTHTERIVAVSSTSLFVATALATHADATLDNVSIYSHEAQMFIQGA